MQFTRGVSGRGLRQRLRALAPIRGSSQRCRRGSSPGSTASNEVPGVCLRSIHREIVPKTLEDALTGVCVRERLRTAARDGERIVIAARDEGGCADVFGWAGLALFP